MTRPLPCLSEKAGKSPTSSLSLDLVLFQDIILNMSIDGPNTFESRTEQMAQAVSPIEDLQQSFRYSAYDWSLRYVRRTQLIEHCVDKILEHIFDLDIEFPERKEQEIRRTIEELLINSSSACFETHDAFITLECTIGREGLVIKVSDPGPGFDYTAELENRRTNPNGLTDDKVLYHVGDNDYPGGSAMYCLLHFTQDFQHNEVGNEVVVKFDL